jgi:tetratricopeptide (TPR) repeat protein
VNLLAAGGFEMPAVMMTLLLVLAVGIRVEVIGGVSAGKSSLAKIRCLMYSAVLPGLFCVVAKTGVFPVIAAENAIRNGNSLLNNAQFPARAIDQFQQAGQSDPQSPTPRQRIAEVLSYRLSEAVALRAAEMETTGTTSDDRNSGGEEIQKLADDALQACEDLIQADRRNSFSYRLRAEVRWNAGLLLNDQELQKLAIQDLQMASNMYPSSVDALYRLAERLDSAGAEHHNAARTTASRVLQMETMNRSWGHADRFLTVDQLATMNRIAKESNE